MRSSLALALALLVLGPTLGGCVADRGGTTGTCDPFVNVSLFHPPSVGDAVLPRDEGASIPLLVWIENTAPTPVHVEVSFTGVETVHVVGDDGEPGGDVIEHEIGEDERSFDAFRLVEPAPGRRVSIDLTSEAQGVEADLRNPLCGDTRSQRGDLRSHVASEEQRAEPGKGVLVRTVGWWTNGTSFYTNLHRFHNSSDLPRNYLGPYQGDDPLKVYVYNDSADEMPERYNESGYATTIPGFNEALKGIPTVGARLAYLEPSEAYTREGYEDHPLYGDPLVFYIEAVEVRTVPCEVPQPVCTPPDEDDVPSGPLGLAPIPSSPAS